MSKFVTDLDYARKGLDKKLLSEYGWLIHYVPDDEEYYANIHTHGVRENFGGYDIQMTMPVPQDAVQLIFADYVERVKKGEQFDVGKRYNDFIRGYDVEFIFAEECERVVLRMIVPDKNGYFPLDKECEDAYKTQYGA